MTSIKSARQKGKDLEDYVADQIKEKGIDIRARRNADSGAGNRDKSDIITNMQVNGKNAGIECKNHAKPHVREWFKQAQKLEVLGCEPILIYKLFGEAKEETKAVIYLSTFLDIVKKANSDKDVIEIPKEDSREMKWKLSRLVSAAKEVIKQLEKDDGN